MSIEGIILMWVCYIPMFFVCIEFIVNVEVKGKSYLNMFLIFPLIISAIGLTSIKRTDIKPQKEKYEQVTETFYRKIK